MASMCQLCRYLSSGETVWNAFWMNAARSDRIAAARTLASGIAGLLRFVRFGIWLLTQN